MKKFNFIFPGQGSQVVGMGYDLYKNHKEARLVYEEVDDVLGFKLSKIIFDGPSDDLTLTTNTQPALMATSMAVVRVIEDELGKDISSLTEMVLGHSLGEYSALCSINAISLSDTSKILRTRGKAMQEAVNNIETKMVAVIGLNIDDLRFELEGYKNVNEEICEIANDNCPGQIILSGTKKKIEDFSEILKTKGAKSILDLNVSAPFHCSLMNNASKVMEEYLSDFHFRELKTKFISNVTANLESDINKIKKLLVTQISNTVRWRESVLNAEKNGPKEFVEIGSGKVLSGMNKRISKNIISSNLCDLSSIENFFKEKRDLL